jgi:hypothetical protein
MNDQLPAVAPELPPPRGIKLCENCKQIYEEGIQGRPFCPRCFPRDIDQLGKGMGGLELHVNALVEYCNKVFTRTTDKIESLEQRILALETRLDNATSRRK